VKLIIDYIIKNPVSYNNFCSISTNYRNGPKKWVSIQKKANLKYSFSDKCNSKKEAKKKIIEKKSLLNT